MRNGALTNRPFAVTMGLVVLVSLLAGWLGGGLPVFDEEMAIAERTLPVVKLEFVKLDPLELKETERPLSDRHLELKPAGIPGFEHVNKAQASVQRADADAAAESDTEQVAAAALGSYQVRPGDSLYLIAKTYGSSVVALRELNDLPDNVIRHGQALQVPLDTVRDYPVGVSLTHQEVDWIARMVHAEARGEPYLGQVAVASVILNRLSSRSFPNTIREVLYQPNAFQPIRNGSFERPANEMAQRAVSEALQGHDPTKGALYFFNPRLSNDRFMHARPTALTIGQHRFMY